VKNTSLKLSATSLASISNVMKSGHSVMPKRKMSLKNIGVNSAMVMYGHGLRYALKQSLFPYGL